MKKIIKIVSFIVLVVVIIFLLIRNLTVREIHCFLNDQAIDDQVVCQQLQQLKGSRLLFRNFQRESVMTSLLYIEETKESFDLVRVKLFLTGEVNFFLSDQPPLYRIEQHQELYLVTVSGFFRENNPQLALPLILDSQQIYQQQPEQVHHFLAQFLQQLPDHREKITQITLISPQRFELKVSNFPMIIIELTQEPQQLARRFKLILEKLKPAEIDLSLVEIDLRFELPVMRTYKSSDSSQVLIDS